MTVETTLPLAAGELHLQRFPVRHKETLQAWDSADQLALELLSEDMPAKRILVLNDSFAALSCGLAQAWPDAKITLWSDSYLAAQALPHNAGLNKLSGVEFVDAVATPQGPFDLVLMRLPKSNSLLRDQVARLLPQLQAGAKVLVPTMLKHLDTSLYEMLTRLLGPLTASRAKKKARLLFASPEPLADKVQGVNPVINCWHYGDIKLSHYSGVYGRKHLDEGSQFFLHSWPKGDYRRIVDLGCGNGILSIQAAKTWPAAEVLGVDESFMAVASATINAEQNAVAPTCRFQVGNCLAVLEDNSADLVLCNPPFHQQRVVGDHLAMAMFADAARVLDEQGELWVVGNRHLGYHAKLKRWFKQVEQQGQHAKFVVLRCRQ
ncbi:MAG TPA: 50S rRNA methyltransferase [Oceanospirillaceae bacterium]|nr:50S rRNA methyltransferase [Oceanospirillaceae bacterium]